jgi:hypothetical protein
MIFIKALLCTFDAFTTTVHETSPETTVTALDQVNEQAQRANNYLVPQKVTQGGH